MENEEEIATAPIESESTKLANGTNKEENSKFPKVTDQLLQKIKKQVEFYFGDVNMHKDKFLIEQTKLNEGWVPMDIMLKFKLLASMSTDPSTIVKALESSELIEVSEDKTKIRRSLDHPLPVYNEEYRKAQEARTVYVKGFPLEDTNIEKLKVFFEPYEPIENIYMRKYQDKEKKMHFKGSIFVQFGTIEKAKEFIEENSIKYGDTELIRRWGADYTAEKQKEKDERKQKKAEQGKKSKNSNEGGADAEADEKENPKLPRGSVLHISGLENCAREDIRNALNKIEAQIAFIDYTRGSDSGHVRLATENEAKAVFEKLEGGKIKIGEVEANVRVLEAEEEEEFLSKMEKDLAEIRKGRSKHGNKFKGGKKGRQQKGQKRKIVDSENENSRKKISV